MEDVRAAARSSGPGAGHAWIELRPARRGSSLSPVAAPGVLERFLVGRRAARLALAVLTFGLAALGLLGVDATARTTAAAAQVRSLAAVSDRWDEFFLQVGVEYEALADYRRADSTPGRTPLQSAIGGASPALRWSTSRSFKSPNS